MLLQSLAFLHAFWRLDFEKSVTLLIHLCPPSENGREIAAENLPFRPFNVVLFGPQPFQFAFIQSACVGFQLIAV